MPEERQSWWPVLEGARRAAGSTPAKPSHALPRQRLHLRAAVAVLRALGADHPLPLGVQKGSVPLSHSPRDLLLRQPCGVPRHRPAELVDQQPVLPLIGCPCIPAAASSAADDHRHVDQGPKHNPNKSLRGTQEWLRIGTHSAAANTVDQNHPDLLQPESNCIQSAGSTCDLGTSGYEGVQAAGISLNSTQAHQQNAFCCHAFSNKDKWDPNGTKHAGSKQAGEKMRKFEESEELLKIEECRRERGRRRRRRGRKLKKGGAPKSCGDFLDYENVSRLTARSSEKNRLRTRFPKRLHGLCPRSRNSRAKNPTVSSMIRQNSAVCSPTQALHQVGPWDPACKL